MPGFRRRSVSPGHAPDREGLPLARETFLLLRGPDRACEGTAGSGGPYSWHLAARVSRERIAPGRSSVRLTSRHRTSERTGLTRRRFRKSPDPKGGTPPCPVAGPLTDTGRRAFGVAIERRTECNPIVTVPALTCGNRTACIPRHTASGRLHATAVRAFCLVPGIKARLKRDTAQNMAGREAALTPGSASRRRLRFEAETGPTATWRLAVAPGFPGRSGRSYREGLPGPAIAPDGCDHHAASRLTPVGVIKDEEPLQRHNPPRTPRNPGRLGAAAKPARQGPRGLAEDPGPLLLRPQIELDRS